MIWWWVGTLLLPAESYRCFAYGPQLVSLLSPVKKGVKADICILQICSTQASSWLHYLVDNEEHWGLSGVGIKPSVLSLSELELNGFFPSKVSPALSHTPTSQAARAPPQRPPSLGF